jgi:tRNA-splicing ligase RtcB (3'-phosphate/5'-hydroxy nucleic acid ligase)
MDSGVTQAIEHLRHAPDVQHIAVMPDVHLSADVCIGVAVATSSLIYPQAVGGDLGCGMLAVALNVEAADLRNPKLADQLLDGLRQVVPARRHNRNRVIPLPEDLQSSNCLSSAKL